MGRYVYVESGNLDWRWKFGFASQCSNLGFILKMLEGEELYVNRYISENEDGEYVNLNADKTDLLKALKHLLKEIKECPVCRSADCLKDTKEMLKDLKEYVEKNGDTAINALWFVEY